MKSTTKTTIKQTARIIRANDSIALICHTNPDGDTIGSAVALYLALTGVGKRVQLFCDGNVSNKITSFLPNGVSINRTFSGQYSLLIAVDCGDIYRIGNMSGIFAAHSNTLVLDHHVGGRPYGTYYCLCEYSSTAEIVYQLLTELDLQVTTDCANLLMMGLSTDTGNFAYSSTDALSLSTAASLRSLGADLPRINQVFFNEISLNRTKLVARMLSRIRTYLQGRLCVVYVTVQELQEFNCTKEDAVDLVNYAINVDTALVGVSLLEHSPNSYKVSIRGKGIIIRDVAESFGGGGHDYAAGCQINGLLEDVIDKLLKLVGDKLA